MNNRTNELTKVTFEFPGGGKQAFEVKGFVGAFTMEQSEMGSKIGAFATGKFTASTITNIASGVIEALAIEMMNQSMPSQVIEDTLKQIISHALASAPNREVDARMEQLEKSDDPMVAAIEQLLKMAVH